MGIQLVQVLNLIIKRVLKVVANWISIYFFLCVNSLILEAFKNSYNILKYFIIAWH